MKESARKCSYCGNNGHNSRTCHDNGGGGGGKCFKLFGVNIVSSEHQSLKKSVSMNNLVSHDAEEHQYHTHETGYLSDGVVHRRKANGTNKGKPWNEEEHKNFLIGLEKLGKGDWRGISKKFVLTRTATQVASHAQKYFLRQTATDKKKRRTSLFDMPLTREHDLATRDLSIGSSSKVPETSSEKCVEIASRSQAMTPSQVADQFPGFCLDPHLIPSNYHGITYMAGGGVSRVLSLVPVNHVMNYPRTEHMYTPKTQGISFAACGLPSGIPAAQHKSFQPHPMPEKDSADQHPNNVSTTLASGSISVP